LDDWSQRDVIDNLEAQLANNNSDLISEIQENIISLEDAAEEASWTEFRRLEGIVDRKNISRMEESIDWKRSCNYMLHEENCYLSGTLYRLQAQITTLRASRPGMESKMEYRHLVLLVWEKQQGWTTTRLMTICHFFLVLMTMGVIET